MNKVNNGMNTTAKIVLAYIDRKSFVCRKCVDKTTGVQDRFEKATNFRPSKFKAWVGEI